MPSQDEASADQPSGSAVAFTKVFSEHYGACLRTARRLVRDEALAHDVVQDVFLAWWCSGGGGYRPDRGELGPWLATLTHHKAVDLLRTADRQRRLLTAVEATLTCEPEERLVDDLVWWELGTQSLVAALPDLPPKQREVLVLAHVAGLTQAEIAERLCIPLGTVKSRSRAGMLRLRAALSSTWTPTGPSEPPPAPPTFREDVERCARDLVRIAAEETDPARGAARMTSRAAALVDEHGDAAAYELVVRLARSSASAASATGPRRPV